MYNSEKIKLLSDKYLRILYSDLLTFSVIPYQLTNSLKILNLTILVMSIAYIKNM